MEEVVDFSTLKRLPAFNYEKVITREDIDAVNYENKFKVWDYIRKSSLVSEGNKEAISLLKDPTIYMYAFFSVEMKSLKLYPYQDLLINDNHRYIIFTAANQVGKSGCLNTMAIYRFLREKNINIAVVSKSLPQSKFQVSRIRQLLNQSKLSWKEESGESESMTLLTMKCLDERNKECGMNRLICAPCTEGLLGYDLHYLFLDEFEFWEVDLKYFYEQTAQPRTYSTKGQIVIFSNPNGQNYVSELERQKMIATGKNKWHRYNFNFLDKPGNTIAEYEQLRAELPRQRFESTVAAIRSSSDRCYFSPDEIERSYDPVLDAKKNTITDKYIYSFLDVGAKHDQACYVSGYTEPDEENDKFTHLYIFRIHLYPVGYPLSRVAGVNVDESDGWHYEKSVREYLDEDTVEGVKPEFGFDVTGNQGMCPLFDALKIQYNDITFSGPVKSGMYQQFKYLMEKGLLHRIRHKEWEKQASELIVSKSQRGYLLINAASHAKVGGKKEDAALKKIPDDCMDSCAGLIHLAISQGGEVSAKRF